MSLSNLTKNLLAALVLLGISLVLYSPTLSFGFVYDDSAYVVENYRIQGLSPAHILAIWKNSFSGHYAPIHQMLLALIHVFSGLNPFGYHLAQVLLHSACVLLLYFFLKKIESPRVAFVAALLFAVYPANIETVAWVSETKSTLAFLFFLLSFWCFVKFREAPSSSYAAGCWLLLLLSLLSKVSTVVAPALFLAYDYRQGHLRKGEKQWIHGPVFLLSIAFVALTLHYHAAVGTSAIERLTAGVLKDPGVIHRADTGGYYGGLAVHLLNIPQLLLFYVRMSIVPYPLSAWQMLHIHEAINWTVILSWLAVACLLFCFYRLSRDLKFWARWFVAFLLPVLQFVPNAVWVADRYLYLPAIATFVLLGKLFWHVEDKATAPLKIGAYAVLGLLLAVYAWQTRHHLPVWQDEISLWRGALNVQDQCAYCRAGLGRALLWNHQPEAAIEELQKALELRPSPEYWVDLGDAYTSLGEYRLAQNSYSTARRIAGPLPLVFWYRVAKAHYLAGDLDSAMKVIEAGLNVDSEEPSLILVRGFVEWRRGDYLAAKGSIQQILAMNSLRSHEPEADREYLEQYWQRPDEVAQLLRAIGPLH
jgi:tetratricopeptide (TPR) repeat protein